MLQACSAPRRYYPEILLFFSDKKTCVFTNPPILPKNREALMTAADEKRAEFDPLMPGQFVYMTWTPITGWTVDWEGDFTRGRGDA